MPSHKSVLIKELKGLQLKRPPESSAATTLDEYNLRLQELFTALLINYPTFAIEHKLELEMWNSLYKSQIDLLQNSFNQRFPAISTVLAGVGGVSIRSKVELKLRFMLLLDRATGVYLNMVHRLLTTVPESSWLKWLLGSSVSPACPLGAFQTNGCRLSGRFDLDLALFTVRNGDASINSRDASVIHLQETGTTNWLASLLQCQPRRMATGLRDDSAGDTCLTSACFDTAPRILSRGDRLPALDVTTATSDPPVKPESSPIFQVEEVEEPKKVTLLEHLSAVQYLVQHCLVHLGDISRYRRQSSVAAGYYIWAWLVHPDSGHPYNQLAILEMGKSAPAKKLLNLFYYYVRAIACEHTFPAATTNLHNLLRSPLSSNLLASGCPQEEKQSSVERPISNLLVQLLSGLHVSLNGERLCQLARELHSSVVSRISRQTDGEQEQQQEEVDEELEQELSRLVVVHIFVANSRLLQATKATPETTSMTSESEDKATDDTDQPIAFEAKVLAQVTVDLVNWLCQQALLFQSSSADCEGQSSADPLADEMEMQMVEQETRVGLDAAVTAALAALNLIFLWLRQLVLDDKEKGEEGAQLLDHLFGQYSSSFSNDLIALLNQLIEKEQQQSLFQTVDSVSSQTIIDWATIISLPEISCLQGFQPLRIPTQSKLAGSILPNGAASSSNTFPTGSVLANYLLQTTRNQRNSPAVSKVTETEVFGETLPNDARIRITNLLQSARSIAKHLPSLLRLDSDSTTGRFVAVGRSTWSVDPFIAPAEPANNITCSTSVAVGLATSPLAPGSMVEVEAGAKENAEIGSLSSSVGQPSAAEDLVSPIEPVPPLTEISGQSTAAETDLRSLVDTSADSHPETSTSSRGTEASDTIETASAGSGAVDKSETSRDEEIVVEGTKSVTTTVPEVLAKIHTPSSNSSCGGLIINSELAKFIQEQANQVAARQKRANGGRQQTTSETAGGVLAGEEDDSLRTGGRCSASTTGVGRPNATTGHRFSLSASFRRDLPPRFAKRLQAELMEREAAAAALAASGGDGRRSATSTRSSANNSSSLLPLDRPAPLARKESEAPYELNSLFCCSALEQENGNQLLPSSALAAASRYAALASPPPARSVQPLLLPSTSSASVGLGPQQSVIEQQHPLFFQASAFPSTNTDSRVWPPATTPGYQPANHLQGNYLSWKQQQHLPSASNLLDWRAPSTSSIADHHHHFNNTNGSSFASATSANDLLLQGFPLARVAASGSQRSLESGLYSVLLDASGSRPVGGEQAEQEQQHRWLLPGMLPGSPTGLVRSTASSADQRTEHSYPGRIPTAAPESGGNGFQHYSAGFEPGLNPVSLVRSETVESLGQPSTRTSSYGYTTTVP